MGTLSFRTLDLSTDDKGVIAWQTADGAVHHLDPCDADPGDWHLVTDEDDRPVMGLLVSPMDAYPGNDGVLALSVDGLSGAFSLLHIEDDRADRVYYCAADGGNTSPLERRTYFIRAWGVSGSPLAGCCHLQILNVG